MEMAGLEFGYSGHLLGPEKWVYFDCTNPILNLKYPNMSTYSILSPMFS